jgi:hypothetical protein
LTGITKEGVIMGKNIVAINHFISIYNTKQFVNANIALIKISHHIEDIYDVRNYL